METEEIMKVLLTLIGKVEPVADSAIDGERLENLEKLLAIHDNLDTIINDLAWDNRNSPYGSVKRVVGRCNKHLDKYERIHLEN